MGDTKKWYQSTGLWGVVVMVLSMIAGRFGYDISSSMQVELSAAFVEWSSLLTGLAGGIVAWIGRLKATKRIG